MVENSEQRNDAQLGLTKPWPGTGAAGRAILSFDAEPVGQ